MRISEVSATELFGVFDHRIEMKDSRITIIHGPNGVGKTVLFRMVHGLFNRRYQVFSEIPFKEFRITFDTGEAIFVSKENSKMNSPSSQENAQAQESDATQEDPVSEFEIRYFDGNEVHPDSYRPTNETNDVRREIFRLIHSATPLEQLDEDIWLDPESGSLLSLGDIIETYESIAEVYWSKEHAWFTDMVKKVHTRFIQTQRLQQGLVAPDRIPYRLMRRREASRATNLTVERYSRNIVQEIQRVSAKYAEESQRIDRVFPKKLDEEWRRLHEDGGLPKYEQDELAKKLAALEEKREGLMDLGLFEGHEAPPLVDVHNELAGVFSIYVDDVDGKFSVFDNISEQLQILTDLINDRFQHKRLTIDKQRGFVIKPLDKKGKQLEKQRIPNASLSSGEQHQLVLFYQLLFDIKPNSLILIDEPEISLHVTWQESFLEDIERASKVGGYDVLIATHSPDIVGEKEEWMVGLGNPENT